jgi:20S proteasome subunit alpha 6
VKQGSVVVGLVSKTHAVLVALKVPPDCSPNAEAKLKEPWLTSLFQRNAEELSSYQKKIIGIDDHFGIALAGLASDARVLSNFMKQQSLASKMTYGRPIPLERMVAQIGDRAQTNTQHYGKRPYGVGLLVAGVDETGPHLFEFQPSGMTQEMVACAIGARSQMARTYLERNLDEFERCGREDLVKHGLKALRESLAQDKELTVENTSIGIIGMGAEGKRRVEGFKLYDGPEVGALLEANQESPPGAMETRSGEPGGESMEVDS